MSTGTPSGRTAAALRQDNALAGELLSLRSETEIDRFIGKLLGPALAGLRKAMPSVGRVIGAVGRAAMPALARAAKQAIPRLQRAGRAATDGDATASDGATDPEVGFGEGSRAARLWGTRLQRRRPREIQMRMARRFVRVVQQAARRAALGAARVLRRGGRVSSRDIERLVSSAILGTARRHTPWLLPTHATVAAGLRRRSGQSGPALHRPRMGRLVTTAPAVPSLRGRAGTTGPSLPTPRSAVLGETAARPGARVEARLTDSRPVASGQRSTCGGDCPCFRCRKSRDARARMTG